MFGRSTSRRLMVESLESRAMLAGNVTVAVTDNRLRVIGDNASNHIEIRELEQTLEGVKLQIIGFDTALNGQADPVTVEGVESAFIGLQSGDNRLQIGNTSKRPPAGTKPVNLPGRVFIGTWAGEDHIKLSIANSESVTINQGPGTDFLFTARCDFNDLTINSDPIPAAGQISVGDEDGVVLRETSVHGAAAITTGIGDDEFRPEVRTVFDGSLAVDLGSGNDLARFYVITLNGPTTVALGAGNDIWDLGASINSEFHADLGSGNDLLAGVRESTTVLDITLGSGHDQANLFSEKLAGITLDGGTGLDSLRHVTSNPEGDETFSNFEVIEDV